MTHTDLIARMRTPPFGAETSERNLMTAAAYALTAAQERIEALEEALRVWKTAFGVADGYAVAIHDADGKCYSVRAKDYQRLHGLYRAALDATDNT